MAAMSAAPWRSRRARARFRPVRSPDPRESVVPSRHRAPDRRRFSRRRRGTPAGLGSTLTNWLLKEEQAGRMDGDMAILLSSVSVANKRIAATVQRDYYTGVNLSERANEIFCEVLGASGRTGVLTSGDAADAAPIAIEESFAETASSSSTPWTASPTWTPPSPPGSIFGVYKGKSCVPDLSAADDEDTVAAKCVTSACRPGSNLVAAGYCMYSSSTILVLTLGDGVHGFTFDPIGGRVCHVARTNPGAPNAARSTPSTRATTTRGTDVRAYVDALKRGGPDQSGKPYSARYIGSLVADDFHRTLLYGGICAQPATDAEPRGSPASADGARPMAFVAEQCGGAASTGRGRVLDQTPLIRAPRTPFYVGSPEEVEYLEKMLSRRRLPREPIPRIQGEDGSAASGSNPASQGDRVGKETLSTWLFRQEQKGTWTPIWR